MTIQEYVNIYKVDDHGKPLNYKKVFRMIQSGKLVAEKIGKEWKITNETKPIASKDNNTPVMSQQLKNDHLALKIKREKQQLYEERLLFLDKLADAVINTWYLPRLAALTNLIRKNGNTQVIEAWNNYFKDNPTDERTDLEEELRALAMEQ